MSKAMSQTIRSHNLRVTMVIVALAMVLFVLTLVAVVQTAPTTSSGDANYANPAMSAADKGGSSITQDPIHRHAEVVQRLGNGSLR
jgi:sensor histidine kinase regulating citrate/malate metabolism